MKYKLLSLFDGSGGFPLAGSLCGVEPVAASEVEPYPIAVTRSRFPNMKHLGDISKINGAEIEPVDIITFGSPCQDLSVAGKRAGLKHEDNGDDETTRSGLFMEAVRIIREMRGATNGKYPTFALWENVPGAFSSNKGDDFRVVLEELIKIVEPTAKMPPCDKNGWPYADCYMGAGWSLAYRVFDAQHWGVPQRRRRIHLVLDLRGERVHKVLFEREGLRWNPPKSGTPWETAPRNAENSIGTADREGNGCVTFHLLQDPIPNSRVSPCMGQGNSKSGQASIGVVQMQAFGDYKDSDVASGLKARDYKDATDLVVEPAPIVLDRAFYNQGVNAQYDPQLYEDGTCPTLVAKGPAAVCVRYIVRRLTPTECARLQGFPDRWGDIDPKENLTDEEYAFWLDVRNTHAAINGKAVKDYTKAQMLTWYSKLHTDSAEYKLWGNGIALPPALCCMQGMVDALDAEAPKKTVLVRRKR